MRRSRLTAAVLTGILLTFGSASQADSAQAWMELMARMWQVFLAMTGNSTLRYSLSPDFGRGNPLTFTPNTMGWHPGAGTRNWPRQPWYRTDPRFWTPPYAAPIPSSPIDGIWETSSGAVLAVRGGRARLYLTPSTWQDFDLRLGNQVIFLRDRQYGSLRTYAYAIYNGRLLMQDAEGNQLLLRRVSDI